MLLKDIWQVITNFMHCCSLSSTQPKGFVYSSTEEFKHIVFYLITKLQTTVNCYLPCNRLLFIFLSPCPLFYQYLLNKGEKIFKS